MSDKKKTTMLDLSGSPEFNSVAAADALNTANATHGMREANKSAVELDRREKVHRALQRFGLATAGASMASPLTAPITESVGAVSDFIDGVLYNLEGKHGQATLSYAMILPVVGAFAAIRRTQKIAEESGEKIYDVYRAVDSEDLSKTIREVKGQEYVVGNGRKAFDDLTDEQLEYAFRKSVPNEKTGIKLFQNYKKTGEFPVSLTETFRANMKYYPQQGYYKDIFGNPQRMKPNPKLRHPQTREIGTSPFSPRWNLIQGGKHSGTAHIGDFATDPYKFKRLTGKDFAKRDYSGKVVLRSDITGTAKSVGDLQEKHSIFNTSIPKSAWRKQKELLKTYDELPSVGLTPKPKYFTTPNMVYATSDLNYAKEYGDAVMHFKVPESHLLDLMKRRKIRGSDELLYKNYKYGLPTIGSGPEMIFDEGIPKEFFHNIYSHTSKTMKSRGEDYLKFLKIPWGQR